MRIGRINLHVDYEKAGVKPETELHPYLSAYLQDDDWTGKSETQPLRDAVIVVPGGGYSFVSRREGDPIAMQFAASGCQTFVLRYSVAPAVFPMALLELALSVKTVREHAAEWHIAPDRIFLAGFSAGGHLAASLSTMWSKGFLADSLNTTDEAIQPNGCILGYPVISTEVSPHQGTFRNLLGDLPEEYRELNSLEKQVDANVPPTFLWTTVTDEIVDSWNTIVYLEALKKAGVDVEAHLFRKGPHGLSLATEVTTAEESKVVPSVSIWVTLAKNWMRDLKAGES